MAMKKFGKLRQWTDEKLGASHKTLATEEFRDMEAEMQLRQQGLDSIHQASLVWMKVLGKQIKLDNQEKEKNSPLCVLGTMLTQHGNDFASGSAYGQALRLFGTNQQGIARLQDNFCQSVSENILPNMQRSLAAMTEYQSARKKLESRRLTYDSALSKAQKAKKEDSKLEEELRSAKIRYEENSEDVQQRMISIREAEANNLRDILDFVDAEAEYFNAASQSLNLLQASVRGNLLPDTSRVAAQASQGETSQSHALAPFTREKDNLDNATTYITDNKTSLRCAGSQVSLASSIRQGSIVSGNRSSSAHDVSDVLAGLRQVPYGSATNNSESPLVCSQSSDQSVVVQPHKVMLVNFSFEAEAINEMSIRAGDLIEVFEEVSSGWWRGQILGQHTQDKPRRGLFPANYCTLHSEDTAELIHFSSQRRQLDDKQRTRLGIPDYDGVPMNSGPHLSQNDGVQIIHEADTSSPSVKARPPPPPIPKKKQYMRNVSSPYSGRMNV